MTATLIGFTAHLTKKGLPSLWETGGYEDGEGYSQIITGPYGERLDAVYIERRANYNEEKALFVVKPGYHFIVASYIDGEFSVQVFRVTKIMKGNNRIEAKCEGNFEDGVWDNDKFKDWEAVEAAMKRANCHNCEKLFWGKDGLQ